MSNKKSWGDVSSDEDSDDERVTRAPLTRPVAPDDDGIGGEDDYADERYAHPPPVVIEGPPYTAFLGNLSYDIRSSTDLTAELESLLRELRLDDVAKVKTARLVTDRPTGQSRGYGYVEFEAKEEVRFSWSWRNNAGRRYLAGRRFVSHIVVSFLSRPLFPFLHAILVIGYSTTTCCTLSPRAHTPPRFGCIDF